MILDFQIPEPLQFNPLKHHLAFIRDFISLRLDGDGRIEIPGLVRDISHIGSSVMDVYTGSLPYREVCHEVINYLKNKELCTKLNFCSWAGNTFRDFRTVTLTDTSCWMLKYNNDEKRFVHLFPARLSPHSFRVKANTLKSAVLYYILIGKDFITREDLNNARKLLGLSPVKTTADAEAIMEMIEVLREQN